MRWATRFATSPVRSRRPSIRSSDAPRTASRMRGQSLFRMVTLAMPVSSSIAKKTVPCAVGGRCRLSSRPAMRAWPGGWWRSAATVSVPVAVRRSRQSSIGCSFGSAPTRPWASLSASMALTGVSSLGAATVGSGSAAPASAACQSRSRRGTPKVSQAPARMRRSKALSGSAVRRAKSSRLANAPPRSRSATSRRAVALPTPRTMFNPSRTATLRARCDPAIARSLSLGVTMNGSTVIGCRSPTSGSVMASTAERFTQTGSTQTPWRRASWMSASTG